MSTLKKAVFTAILFAFFIQAKAQGVGVGVESPNPNAVLELVSPNNNQGLLIPKVTTAQRTSTSFTDNLSSNENGLLVYDSDEDAFYFWMNSQWVSMQNSSGLLAGLGIQIVDGEIVNTGDLDPTNEIQDISLLGTDLTITDGSTIDLSGLDTNTQLTEAEVDAFVSNNGFIDAETDPTIPANLKDGVDYSEVTNTPTIPSTTGELTNDAGFITNPNDADSNPSNETITNLNLNNTTLEITEAGATSSVDLAGLQDGFEANTDDQTATEVGVTPQNGITENNVQAALEQLAGDISAAGGGDMTTSVYDTDDNGVVDDAETVNGLSVETSVPAGALFTDTQLTNAEVETIVTNAGFLNAEVDGSVTNEIVTNLNLVGTELQLTEAGATSTLDLASLQDGTGTDDQVASEVNVTPSGNLGSGNVQAALEELQTDINTLAAGGSDGNDFVTAGNLSGTDLTLNIPNQTNPVIDLAGLQDGTGTDDQTATEVGVTPQNGITENNVQAALEQLAGDISAAGGGDMTTSVYDTDDNGVVDDAETVNGLSVETAVPAGALFTDTQLTNAEVETIVTTAGFLNAEVDGSVTNETITNLNLSGTELQITEAGATSTLELGSLQDGFEANTDDQTATEVGVTPQNGITENNVQAALEQLAGDISAAGGGDMTTSVYDTDDNGVVDDAETVNGLSIETAVPAGAVFTDTQLSDAEVLTIVSTNGIDFGDLNNVPAGIADGTDDVNDADADPANEVITNLVLNTTTLEITEAGATTTVELSSLQDGTGTDDQNASEVDVTDAGGNFTNTNVEGVLEEIDTRIDALVLAGGSDGNDFVTGGNLSGTNLTLEIPNQTNPVINLAGLQDGTGTDDQTISFDGTNISIEGGNSVDISSIDTDTDTDDQTLAFDGTNLSIADGNSVDISGLADGTGTDDQTISFDGTSISIEGGNSVDISSIDTDTDTDDQTLAFDGTNLSIADGNAVDISSLADGTGTDDQTISFDGTSISIEGGNSVDISSLADGTGTDDQNASEVDVTDAGGNFTNTNVEGVLEEIDTRIDALVLAGGSDGNDFVTGGNLSGTNLTLDIPNQTNPVINLAGLQDGTGTDDQTISFDGTNISIEGGNSVDISSIDTDTDTDDQTLAFDGTNLSIADGNSVDISSLADGTGTDDQTISFDGTNISIEGGNSVDISSIDTDTDTDDQTLAFDGTNLSIADGNSVDISGLADGTGTDDQTISFDGTSISIEGGNSVDISSIDTDTDTDDQTLAFDGTNLSIADGNSVDISGLADGTGTDDQRIDLLDVNGNNLRISLEGDGQTPRTVDLSILQDGTGTDNQTLAVGGGNLTISGGNSIPLASIQDGTGTDDQTISFDGTNISIEGGNSVDISSIDTDTDTDDQTLAFDGTNLSIADGNSVDISSLADGTGTDDQRIDLLDVNGNNLRISLEGDGQTPRTVDLSILQDGTGTDNQTLAVGGGNLTISGGNSIPLTSIQDGTGTDSQTLSTDDTPGDISLTNGGSITLNVDDADASTTNEIQDLQFAGNILSLTNDPGNTTINFSAWDQNASDDLSLPISQTSSVDGANGIIDLTNTGNGHTAIFDGGSTRASLRAFSAGDGAAAEFDHGRAGNGDNIALFRSQGNVVASINDVGQFFGDGSQLTNLPAGNWNTLSNIPAGFADNTDNDNQNLSFTDDPATINISGGSGIDVSNWDLDSSDDFFLPANESLNTGATVLDLTNGGAGTVASFTSSSNVASTALTVTHSANGQAATFTNSGDNNNAVITSLSLIGNGPGLFSNRGIIIGNLGTEVEGAIRYSAGTFEGYDGSVWNTFGGGSSSPWTGSPNISYLGGTVGIGTSGASELFEVSGSDAIRVAGKIRNTNSSGGGILTLENDQDLGGFDLGIGGSAGSFANSFYLYDWNNDNPRMVVGPTDTYFSNPSGQQVLTIDDIDDVLIGSGVAQSDLYVNGTIISEIGVMALSGLNDSWELNGDNDFFIANSTGEELITLFANDNVTIGNTTANGSNLTVNGSVTASSFVGDGSGLTNLPGGSSQWSGTNSISFGGTDATVDVTGSTNPAFTVQRTGQSTNNIGLSVQNLVTSTDMSPSYKIGLQITSTGAFGSEGGTNIGLDLNVSGGNGTNIAARFNGGDVEITNGQLESGIARIGDFSSATTFPVLFVDGNFSGDAAMRFSSSNSFTMGVDGSDNTFKISDATSFGTNDRLVIDAAGDVGIGNTNPLVKLDVDGVNPQAVYNNSSAGVIQGYNRSTAGGVGVVGSVNDNNAVATGDRTGLVGIAWYGQSVNYGTFSYGFGGTTSYGIRALGNGGSTTNYGIYASASGTGATNWAGYFVGNVAYTGTISDVSDRRLKENLKPIESASNKLGQLQGYSYNMIEDSLKTREYGLMAQDVQEVLPHAVSVMDPEKGYLGLSYTQLVPVLVEAHKEQETTIESLQRELKQMKEKLKVSETSKASLQSQLDMQSSEIAEIKKLLGIKGTEITKNK